MQCSDSRVPDMDRLESLMNNQERNQIKKLLESASKEVGIRRVPEEILTMSVRWQLFKHYMYQFPTDTSLLIDFPRLARILIEINQRTTVYNRAYMVKNKVYPSGVQLDVFQKSVYEELQEARRNASSSTGKDTTP